MKNKFYEIHISANVTRKLTELYLLSYKSFCFKAWIRGDAGRCGYDTLGETSSGWLQVEVIAFIPPWGVIGSHMVDDWVLQGCYNALVGFLEGRNEVVHSPKEPPVDPRCCLSTPGTSLCLGHSVGVNITLMQHAEAVDSRDALAVPQQVAAVRARRQQQLLPGLPADGPVVDGHRVHARASPAAAALPRLALPPTA